MDLRDYQQKAVADIYAAWHAGHRNVGYSLPTGGGKTVIFSSIMRDSQTMSIAIAHRQELVCQMALALARNDVAHRIIAPESTIRTCVGAQMDELGRHAVRQSSKVFVAGVDTLIRRGTQLREFLPQVGLWVIDECHHLLRDNKWGKAAAMFPNAYGLGVSATFCRADGAGLGRHSDGLIDTLIQGPTARDLINRGYLTDYRIFAPPSDLQVDDSKVSKTGDWTTQYLREASKKSHIVGDVVSHYRQIAPGKLGVTFVTDVETAHEVATAYRAAGVPAEVLSAKTPDQDRREILRRLRNRKILQLVNVDICGEGFDLPAIEVVTMARPTASYSLYAQQFGRGLRILEGKTHAIIIDHVGNVLRHGLPDKPRVWTLDAREKRPRMRDEDDEVPLRICVECTAPYERIHQKCPYCGAPFVPASRARPEYVDGDLLELDPAVLAQMRGERDKIDAPADSIAAWLRSQGKPEAAVRGYVKAHGERQTYQQALRECIAWWAGIQQQLGRSDSESYRRFYHQFGVDVLSAQALGKPDAIALIDKINATLGKQHDNQ